NGGRAGSTAILADGGNKTGGGIARAVGSFPPETAQEFTGQSSAYSAEFGATGGGRVKATTQTRNKQYHGLRTWGPPQPGTKRVAVSHRQWSTAREQSSLQPGLSYYRWSGLPAAVRRRWTSALRWSQPDLLLLRVRTTLAPRLLVSDDFASDRSRARR